MAQTGKYERLSKEFMKVNAAFPDEGWRVNSHIEHVRILGPVTAALTAFMILD